MKKLLLRCISLLLMLIFLAGCQPSETPNSTGNSEVTHTPAKKQSMQIPLNDLLTIHIESILEDINCTAVMIMSLTMVSSMPLSMEMMNLQKRLSFRPAHN